MIFPDPGPALSRPFIKICGLTHPDDAQAAIEFGADALGLNFFAGSRRCLDVRRDADWIKALPNRARRIGVLVNAARAEIDFLFSEGLVDAVQLHGDEDAAYCRALRDAGVPFIKAIRLRHESDLTAPERFGTPWVVLDAYREDAFGGTGQLANWELAARFVSAPGEIGRRTLLSGGLTAANVAEAIRRVCPAGVDAASGVERPGDPRRKDLDQMREFFAAVRGA